MPRGQQVCLRENMRSTQRSPFSLWVPIMAGFFALLVVCVLLLQLFAPSRLVMGVKNGRLEQYSDVTIGDAVERFMSDTEWSSEEGKGGLAYVTASGVAAKSGEPFACDLTFKVNQNNDTFTPVRLSIDGQEQSDFVLAGFLYTMYEGANSKALADIKNAYTASQAYYTDYPLADVALSDLVSYGLKIKDGVEIDVLQGEQPNLKIRSHHQDGTKEFTINAAGDIYTEIR